MEQFELAIPTKIYFGNEVYREALKKERGIVRGNVLLVTTGRSLYRFGYIKNVLEALRELQTVESIEVFDQISANPKLDEVKKGIETGRRAKVSIVIGLGGGSALDAAKAIAVGIGNEEPIENFLFDGYTPSDQTLPIVAIPTTAGTGSELSKGAIITSLDRKIKTGIRGEAIYPKIAIVDPSFTIDMPYDKTMETGFDVFAHAVESYISRKATPFSEMLSEKVISVVSKALIQLSQNLSNAEARGQMSYASMVIGMNLGNVGTALPHRLQYPIGAQTDTSHAAGLIALYPAWISQGYQYSVTKFNKVASILRGRACSTKVEVEEAFRSFINDLKISRNLYDLGILPNDLDLLVNQVTGSINNDPASEQKDIIRAIYIMAMNGSNKER